YSSAVFIGWGCVLLCLFIEFLYRNGFGVAGGAVLGFATLIIAHHLGGSGDTLEMMQAVLDTNFLPATHLTTGKMGGTAPFVAGAFGLAYVLLGVTTRLLDTKPSESGAASPASTTRVAVGLGLLQALVLGWGFVISINRTFKNQKLGKTLAQIIYGIVCF